MFHNFVFILLIISFPALALAKTSNSFSIYQKDLVYTKPVKIGSATITESHLNFYKKKVIHYEIDLKFRNQGVIKKEHYEVVADFESLDFIYSRYENLKDLKITMTRDISNKKKLRILAIKNNLNDYKRTIGLRPGVFPYSLLYVKLARVLSSGLGELSYNAVNEDKYMSYNVLGRGRAIYKGIQNVDVLGQKHKLHIFANSFDGRSEFIYFDLKKKFIACALLRPGVTIIFYRDK